MKPAKGILFDLDQTLVNSSPAELYRNRKQWEEAYKKIPECSLYSGISELIQDLQSAGWKIGIVTSSPRKYAEKVIQHFDFRYDTLKCFHDTPRHKPNPDPYSVALEEMKVKRAFAWAVGDSQDDIDAANTLGIVSIDARWGKLQESSPSDQCQNCDLFFDQPTELGDFLLQRTEEVLEQQSVSKKSLSDSVKSKYGFQISGGPKRYYGPIDSGEASYQKKSISEWSQIDYKIDCPKCASEKKPNTCITYTCPHIITNLGVLYEQHLWAFVCMHCHAAFELSDISRKDKKNRPTLKRRRLRSFSEERDAHINNPTISSAFITTLFDPDLQELPRKGTIAFPSGDKYVGEYRDKDNRPHGQGTFTFACGDQYIGEFRDGSMHGQGAYTSSDGRKYVGEYRNSKRNGQGTCTWPNGANYVGQWKDGKRHGQGTFVGRLKDYVEEAQGKYVGEFRDGVLHGQGAATEYDGKHYVGEFRNSKRNGQGTCTWPNGANYVGQWKDGKRHGQGTFVDVFRDGKAHGKYVGEWKEGEQHGFGAYDSDDFKYTGEWLGGKPCSVPSERLGDESCSAPSGRFLAGVGSAPYSPQYGGLDDDGRDDMTDGPLSDDWDEDDWEQYMSGPDDYE